MTADSQNADSKDKKQSPQWHEAIALTEYPKQYDAFIAFFNAWQQWFAIKSNFARHFSKLGLLVLLNGALLYFLNGTSLAWPTKPTPVSQWVLACQLIVPSFIILFALAHDTNSKATRIATAPASELLITIALICTVFTPFLTVALGGVWQYTITPMIGLGAGVSIISYLINRLEGYTRAWSRYRTALFKIQLNHSDYLTGKINDSQAQRRMLNIVNDEIEDRHRDIINDFHFFGDSVANLLRKK